MPWELREGAGRREPEHRGVLGGALGRAHLPDRVVDDTPAFVAVVVDKGGQVYLSDQPVAPAELAARLAEVAGQRADTEVQLRADDGVPYGRVVEVIGIAQKAGLTRIGFVTEPPRAAPVARQR